MTVQQILNKYTKFKALAKELGVSENAELRAQLGDPALSEPVDPKWFKRRFRNIYADEMADAILAYDGYELDKQVTVICKDKWGTEMHEQVTFFIENW